MDVQKMTGCKKQTNKQRRGYHTLIRFLTDMTIFLPCSTTLLIMLLTCFKGGNLPGHFCVLMFCVFPLRIKSLVFIFIRTSSHTRSVSRFSSCPNLVEKRRHPFPSIIASICTRRKFHSIG